VHETVIGKEAVVNEARKAEILQEREALKEANEWLEKRLAEYPSHQDMIVALWEKVVEGREESASEIQAKRVEIKQKYPKPEGK
ncbi:hypothetical protein RZS08_40655, partial [Arthrospira platensis SPKY1]|nr:hypothetical protein [Arthrospira platensis SPKY1]